MTCLTFRSSPTKEDCSRVRAIIESSGYFYPSEVDVAVELVEERLTKGEASGYYFIFAEEKSPSGKVVIGYTCYGPIACTVGSYDLYWIAVDESRRRCGIGKKLLEETEREIGNGGGRHIYIETSGRDKYLSTRSFYKRCGYHAVSELEDFYAPGDSKVVYRKVIS